MKSKSGVPSDFAGKMISDFSISSFVHLLLNAYFTLSFLITVAMKMAIKADTCLGRFRLLQMKFQPGYIAHLIFCIISSGHVITCLSF